MDIQEIKQFMKANKITQIKLAEMSGVPLQTLRDIFSGSTRNPRIDTVQAIEKALGLAEAPPKQSAENKAETYSEAEKRLINAYRRLVPNMQEYFLEIIEQLAAGDGAAVKQVKPAKRA